MRLAKKLAEFLKGSKVALVIGVGNEMRGDDGAGIALARMLKKTGKMKVMEGGTAPENLTSRIKRLKPSHMIFVDAADFGGRPGEVTLADPSAVAGRSVSTHTLPLSLMAKYLESEIGAKVLIVGIQPEHAIFGGEMSPAVKRSVERLARELEKAFERKGKS